MTHLMLDLCCGLKGASETMSERGWDVVTLDNEPAFEPDIVADVRKWQWDGTQPDLIWASPPCVEFSRESMPWSRTGQQPDMSIVRGCLRVIRQARPRFWIIENVRGAISHFRPLLGDYRYSYGPFYLWGYFPELGAIPLDYRKKESYGSKQRAERAKIPAPLSLALALAIERQPALFEVTP